jgi:serine/threonine protein kinase/Tfp pilus assembly protein PilF
MSTCLNCGHADASDFSFCPRCGTRAAEAASGGDPLLGRTLNNKYRIEEKIGAGAMGTVYLGEHIGLKKKVALKILHADLQVSDDALQRFQREGIAAGKFNHPHAIQIFDFDRSEGQLFYLAMEFVDGVNLTQFLSDHGALAYDTGVGLARQLLSCLAEAHRHGIIHRDLKPDNIMVVEDVRGELRLKVLDFGLSKLVNRRIGSSLMTQPGRLLGTPLYMAPEQIAGEEADARSDVYAAGLILYEMLAGVRPWKETDLGEVFMTRMKREAPSLAEDHPGLGVPAELDIVVSSALARDRAERFATAEEMLIALENVPLDRDPMSSRSRQVGASSKGKPAASKSRATASRPSVSRVPAPRISRADTSAESPKPRVRKAWIGIGVLIVALLGGTVLWRALRPGARPARVRMVADADRDEDERRYVKLLDEARAALRSREPQRAMSSVDQALALPCHDAEGLCVRAEAYAAKGDLDTALADYRAACQTDPTYVEARLGMAWISFDRGDIDAAEREFSEAAAIDPAAASVIAGRGALTWRRGQVQEAAVLFDRALAADPSSPRANRYAGRLCLELGDADCAIARLVEAKRSDPRSPETAAWLGEAYLARQRFDDADVQFQEALSIEPNLPHVRELRGSLLLERGRTSEAAEFLKQALERHPDRAALWVLRGSALQASGDNAGALEAVKRGFDLGEHSLSTRTLLGVLYQRAGRLDPAIAEFEAVLAEDESVPVAHLDLGLALFTQGKYERAAGEFERVLALAEDDAAAHLHLGLLHMDYLGDAAKARAHLQRYLELGGDDARVKGWLAKLP